MWVVFSPNHFRVMANNVHSYAMPSGWDFHQIVKKIMFFLFHRSVELTFYLKSPQFINQLLGTSRPWLLAINNNGPV